MAQEQVGACHGQEGVNQMDHHFQGRAKARHIEDVDQAGPQQETDLAHF